MRDSIVFAPNYQQAHAMFDHAVRASGGRLQSHRHALRGAQGETLEMLSAWFGRTEAQKVLVISSGLHGVEGYAGSAAQIAGLRNGLAAFAGDDVAIWLLHGLNPWGFSHGRRCDENGVDLNRNFLDFSQPLPPTHPYFTQLVNALVPKDWLGEGRLKADMQIAEFLRSHDFSAVKQMIATGQYEYDYAPFYGGAGPSWTASTLETLIKQHLRNRAAVAWIDIHTGLGPHAQGALLGDAPIENHAGRAPDDLTTQIWGEEYQIDQGGDTVSYQVRGGLTQRVRELLPNLKMLSTVVHEFGVAPPLETLNALRADHWLYTYAPASPTAAQIKQELRAVFDPQDDAWRENIIAQSLALQERAAKSLVNV